VALRRHSVMPASLASLTVADYVQGYCVPAQAVPVVRFNIGNISAEA
jgi:hypothetical protein